MMIKFTILLKRRTDLTFGRFVEHHRHRHAELFASVPVVRETVRRYVQQHLVPGGFPGLPAPRYDGITELWFDETAAIERLFTDPDYLARVRPDEEAFLDLAGCDSLVTEERPVLPPR